jgi:hypothetical protein
VSVVAPSCSIKEIVVGCGDLFLRNGEPGTGRAGEHIYLSCVSITYNVNKYQTGGNTIAHLTLCYKNGRCATQWRSLKSKLLERVIYRPLGFQDRSEKYDRTDVESIRIDIFRKNAFHPAWFLYATDRQMGMKSLFFRKT